jgi:glycosyltransferase involved in cell wall biosynthesis
MKVLVLSNYYPPCEQGGYEQLCRDVVERLGQRGYEVAVLTSNLQPPANGRSESPAVYRLLRLQPRRNRWLLPQFFLTRRRDEAYNRQCLRQLMGELRPDVVFFWNLQFLPRSLAVDAEAMPGAAVAYWLAGYTPAEPDEFWLYWQSLPAAGLKRTLKSLLAGYALRQMRAEGKPPAPRMDHVAVVSDYYRRKSVAAGWLPAHAGVIYNGVEVEAFYRPVRPRLAEPLRLLQAGRVSPDKGVDTAIEAVAQLVNERGVHDVLLTVAGSGTADYEAELLATADRLGIGPYVIFTGWLPREQMPALMGRSHVLLLPTPHQEPFARVVLEGMAAGLAVVATLTGGTGEIVTPEETGLTFAAGDSRQLAEQLQRLAEDDNLRCSLAQAGQRVVQEQYSLDRMVDGLEGLLAEAVAALRGQNEHLRRERAS